MTQCERLLPLPYLPTYIARRPVRPKTDDDLPARSYEPLFALNWQKSSKRNYIYERSPFIVVEPDWLYVWHKQYDTYKQSFHDIGISSAPPTASHSVPAMPSLPVPNHLTRTSEQWSRFLDEYSDRFKIDYSEAIENGHPVMPHPGRYPYQTEKDSLNLSVGHPSRIHPVMNTFRQRDLTHPSANNRPVWLPYGTVSRR